MANNDQLLKQIENLIKQELEPVKQGQAQTNTALEAVKSGLDDLRENVANLPTRAEFQDFSASVGRTQRDHASRIEDLEKEVGIPHPHKQ